MQLVKIITGFALTMAAMTFPAIDMHGQYRLPASHNNQHKDLIANQRPAGVDLESVKLNAYLKDITDREALQDNEIFTYNWESQSVNAYAGIEVPATHDLDVSGYVHPLRTSIVTSQYGYRPRFGRMHKGIDLSLQVGDTVVAAFDGKVRLTKFERRGYGYYVVIRHDNGMETVYGHLSGFLVKPNQRVKAGQPIALGGNTGRSTGPHLHFETRFLGMAINPMAIIDFENSVTHKDIFTFEKASYEKSQKYGPKTKKYKASKRKRKSKATASAKKKRRRR